MQAFTPHLVTVALLAGMIIKYALFEQCVCSYNDLQIRSLIYALDRLYCLPWVRSLGPPPFFPPLYLVPLPSCSLSCSDALSQYCCLQYACMRSMQARPAYPPTSTDLFATNVLRANFHTHLFLFSTVSLPENHCCRTTSRALK